MTGAAGTATLGGDGFKLHIRFEHIRYVRESPSAAAKGHIKLEIAFDGGTPTQPLLEVHLPEEAAKQFVDGFNQIQFQRQG